ncbi:protein FAM189B-like, partial [Scleropages formosus]
SLCQLNFAASLNHIPSCPATVPPLLPSSSLLSPVARPAMPSPSDSGSAASVSGSRALSGSRRGISGRGGARLLLYLGLCHLSLGAMVLAFSFTSLAFTSSPRVRQSCPFWAGFFVSLFMLLSAVCVILSLAGSMLSCQNAQMVKSLQACQVEDKVCWCCDAGSTCSMSDDSLMLYLHADCHSARHQLKDLLFSACGLSILSTIICTLSTVTCSIHIFSLDLLHLLVPHRSRSVNPECSTPQDAFLTNAMDFEEFVPPIPPPPYYPPEYTCSSETDAQSITYNGSMESPVPLYPTDCPPPYEAVMGQRAASQATVYDTHVTELSGERGTSTAFSGEVSMDSGSLLMSEIVDIPDDSSPSEDSCLLEVTVGVRGRGSGAEGGEYVSFRCPSQSQQPLESPVPAVCPSSHRCFRGERSNSCSSPSSTADAPYRSPVLRHQAMLASSCSQLELVGGSGSPRSSIPEIRVRPCTPNRQGYDTSASASTPVTSVANRTNSPSALLLPPYPHRRGGAQERRDSDSLPLLVRSHSEPGLSSSTDTEACLLPRTTLALTSTLPRKGSMKAGTGQLPLKPPPATSLRVPKDCARSLGDLKVTRVLVARLLQRSKRNLAPPPEHAGNGGQVLKRRPGGEGSGASHHPFGQVLRNSWGSSRGQQYQQRHRSHHSHSDSRHNRRHDNPVQVEGIHLRSCGDLSSSSAASLRRLLSRPHSSSATLYTESA